MDHEATLRAVGTWCAAVCAPVPEILPPRTVWERFSAAVGRGHGGAVLERIAFGTSRHGFPIDVFVFGAASRTVFLYGFPDPGEAVAATGLVLLLERLLAGDPFLLALDVRWVFLPLANWDDQPHRGERLARTTKQKHTQEIDWPLAELRPETAALFAIAERFRPCFTFAGHDEFHDGADTPAYVVVSPPVTADLAAALRSWLERHALPLAAEPSHPLMGPGFGDMRTLAGSDWERSTFRRFAEHGSVVIIEVADVAPPARLLVAQLGGMLCLLRAALAGADDSAAAN